MIRFGPSGNSKSFYDEGNKGTLSAMQWVADRGLNAFEISFGRGISMSNATAAAIGEQAAKYGVEISVHAPYYINFANPSDEMAEKSNMYIINSCEKLKFLGGRRVVFHVATVGKMQRVDAVELAKKRLEILVDRIYQEKLDNFLFCPETMGKINQIGDLDETLEFCKIDKCLLPTIDFGHLNARTHGALKTLKDFDKIVSFSLQQLGYEKVNQMHIHFSKIEFNNGGEVRHLNFDDVRFGPEFQPLAVALAKYNLHPVVVSESADMQAEDALTMKNLYENALKSKESNQ